MPNYQIFCGSNACGVGVIVYYYSQRDLLCALALVKVMDSNKIIGQRFKFRHLDFSVQIDRDQVLLSAVCEWSNGCLRKHSLSDHCKYSSERLYPTSIHDLSKYKIDKNQLFYLCMEHKDLIAAMENHVQLQVFKNDIEEIEHIVQMVKVEPLGQV